MGKKLVQYTRTWIVQVDDEEVKNLDDIDLEDDLKNDLSEYQRLFARVCQKVDSGDVITDTSQIENIVEDN